MSAHTPGPWYVGERASYHGMSFIEIHSEAKIGRIKMPAHLLGPVARTDQENARLIAAAPDLLAALQFLMTASGEQLTTAFEQAQEAITKATGEAA